MDEPSQPGGQPRPLSLETSLDSRIYSRSSEEISIAKERPAERASRGGSFDSYDQSQYPPTSGSGPVELSRIQQLRLQQKQHFQLQGTADHPTQTSYHSTRPPKLPLSQSVSSYGPPPSALQQLSQIQVAPASPFQVAPPPAIHFISGQAKTSPTSTPNSTPRDKDEPSVAQSLYGGVGIAGTSIYSNSIHINGSAAFTATGIGSHSQLPPKPPPTPTTLGLQVNRLAASALPPPPPPTPSATLIGATAPQPFPANKTNNVPLTVSVPPTPPLPTAYAGASNGVSVNAHFTTSPSPPLESASHHSDSSQTPYAPNGHIRADSVPKGSLSAHDTGIPWSPSPLSSPYLPGGVGTAPLSVNGISQLNDRRISSNENLRHFDGSNDPARLKQHHNQASSSRSLISNGSAATCPPTYGMTKAMASKGLLQGGYPSSASSKRRIDAASLPRPVKLQCDIVYHTRSGNARCIPPLSNSGFVAVDTGNCSPRHMRVTMCAPPGSKEVCKRVGIPYALVCTPMAEPEEQEIDVQLCNFGKRLPPRCRSCCGYVNCNVSWTDEGNSWVCNLCSQKNDVEPWYFCSLDGSGNRLDRKDRPELTYGSYDIELPAEMHADMENVSPVQEPVYIFAIDASSRSASNGTLAHICSMIRDCLRSLPGIESGIRVGVLTFGEAVHFYRVAEHPSKEGNASVHEHARTAFSSDSFDAPQVEPNFSVSVLVVDPSDPFAALPVDQWILPLRSQLSTQTQTQRATSAAPVLSHPPTAAVSQSSRSTTPTISVGTPTSVIPKISNGAPIRSQSPMPLSLVNPFSANTHPSPPLYPQAHSSGANTPSSAFMGNARQRSDSFNAAQAQKQATEAMNYIKNMEKIEYILAQIPLLARPEDDATSKRVPSNHNSYTDLSVLLASPSINPSGHANNDEQAGNCPIAAIALIVSMVEEDSTGRGQVHGGKGALASARLYVFTTSASTVGVGKYIRRRESLGIYGTPSERVLYANMDSVCAINAACSPVTPELSRSVSSGSLFGSDDQIPQQSASHTTARFSPRADDGHAAPFTQTPTTLSAPRPQYGSTHPAGTPHTDLSSRRQNITTSVASAPVNTPLAYFKELAAECVRKHVVVNMLVVTKRRACVDIPVLSECCDATGGACSLFYYSGKDLVVVNGAQNQTLNLTIQNIQRLRHEIEMMLLAPFVSDCVMKVRTNGSASIRAIHGPGIHRSSEDDKDTFAVRNMRSETTYTVFLDPTNKHSQVDDVQTQANTQNKVHIQYAVMFTTPYQQRVIRVHNLCLFATNNPTVIFKNVDVCACVSTLFAATAYHVFAPLSSTPGAPSSSSALLTVTDGISNNIYLGEAHKKLYEVCLSLLYNYRILCAAHSPKNHLILPEALRLLPLYVFGMLKHPALVDNNPINLLTKTSAQTASKGSSTISLSKLGSLQTTSTGATDIIVRGQDRACVLRRVRGMSCKRVMDTLFPRVFVLHVMLDDEEFDDILDLDIDSFYRQNKGVYLSIWEQEHLSQTSLPLTPHTPFTPLSQTQTAVLASQPNSVPKQLQQLPQVPGLPPSLHISTNTSAVAAMTPRPVTEVLYRSPAAAAHLVFRLPRVQVCSLDLLESDGVYVLDDASCGSVWLFIGRNIPEQSLMDWFLGLRPGDRPRHVTFNTSSRNGRVLKIALDIVLATADAQPDVKVVWGDCVDSDDYREFCFRCVENSFRGEDDYTDFLTKMHASIAKSL